MEVDDLMGILKMKLILWVHLVLYKYFKINPGKEFYWLRREE